MAGSILVGGVADYRQALRNFALKGAKNASKLALAHAARYTGVKGGITLSAGIAGYAATGTLDGALTTAAVGNMVCSATARFTVACFAAGTPLVVDFEGNSRSIEEIEVGDDVLARSEFDAAGPLELKRVEEKFVRVAPVMELVVQGQVITTTAEHPFYVAGEERFVPAGELTLEDQLVDSQGRPIAIDAIRVTDRLITVYNLRVADFHTYFVGGKLWQFDAWVHNASYAPRSAAARVNYDESDMASVALDYRRTRSGMTLRDGRRLDKGNGNIAVFEYLDDNNQLTKRAFLNRMNIDHSELWGMRVLNRAGISRDRVTRIYSELEYCPGCESLTKASFPNASRSYSFPYNIQRALGRQMKSDAVRSALGE